MDATGLRISHHFRQKLLSHTCAWPSLSFLLSGCQRCMTSWYPHPLPRAQSHVTCVFNGDVRALAYPAAHGKGQGSRRHSQSVAVSCSQSCELFLGHLRVL